MKLKVHSSDTVHNTSDVPSCISKVRRLLPRYLVHALSPILVTGSWLPANRHAFCSYLNVMRRSGALAL
jgi:hypothetical protein